MFGSLRILLVHPHIQLFGGSEVLTRILVNELSTLGHETVVLSSGIPEDMVGLRNVKFEVFRDISSKVSADFILPLKTEKVIDIIYSVAENINRYGPDVCLVMIQEPIYVVATKLADPNMGTAIYIHYPFEEELTSENIYVFLDLYRFPYVYENLYKLADLHMSNSNYTASALYRSFGIESNVVYPAINWEYFEEQVDVSSDRGTTILTVGRFVPQKRQDVLLDWFKRFIKPEVPDAELIIIGMPDRRFQMYYERLRRLSSEIEGVTLIDRILPPREMMKYYRMAKVYVHLRLGEHFGMAPVEAMSQGAIPLLPENSGIAELVTHGRDGYVASNDGEFINYIIKLLKTPEQELAEVRRFAYRRAWYFNPDRFAKEVIHYLKIISRSQTK